MKLIIQRNQAAKKGIFGGHKGMTFSLFCKVEISQEEQELIAKYKANDLVLTWAESERGKVPELTIQGLLHGHRFEIDQVGMLLGKEEEIKQVCAAFKQLIMVMASFGGEEVVEI